MQKDHAPKVPERSNTQWQFYGCIVCPKFFQFVFTTGEKRIKNEKKRLAEFGITEKPHGNTDNTNGFMTESKQNEVLQFIANFTAHNAL